MKSCERSKEAPALGRENTIDFLKNGATVNFTANSQFFMQKFIENLAAVVSILLHGRYRYCYFDANKTALDKARR